MENDDNNNNDNNSDKWPWSITDREFGALEQEVKEIRHVYRNLKMIVNESGISHIDKDDINAFRDGLTNLEERLKGIDSFQEDIIKLKIKVYTAFSVIGILAAIIVWIVEAIT